MKGTIAVLTAPKQYCFMEEDLPTCGENDVIVEMKALGLCHSDMPAFMGSKVVTVNPSYGFREPREPCYPMKIGHEAVGVVVEAGRNVKKFRVGDYVTGRMRYSQRTVMHIPNADVPAPTVQLFKIPETEKDKLCCLGEPMECVINMIRETRPQYGDYIAVVGCGFMGLLTIAGLSKCGCKKLVAIDLDEKKLKLAKEFGASDCIQPDCTGNISEWAYEMTDGRFFDAVVEVTGSIYGLDTALKIVKFTHKDGNAVTPYMGNGRIISSSVYAAEEIMPATLGFNLMVKGPIIHNVHPSYSLDAVRNEEQGIEAFLSGTFPMERLVTHRFPFSEIAKGMECLVHPPEDYIKGIIVFD